MAPPVLVIFIQFHIIASLPYKINPFLQKTGLREKIIFYRQFIRQAQRKPPGCQRFSPCISAESMLPRRTCQVPISSGIGHNLFKFTDCEKIGLLSKPAAVSTPGTANFPHPLRIVDNPCGQRCGECGKLLVINKDSGFLRGPSRCGKVR